MRKLTNSLLAVLPAFVLMLGLSPQASAHQKGPTIWKVGGCAKIKTPRKRHACRQCIRQGGHHFHAGALPGVRCMRNAMGKPGKMGHGIHNVKRCNLIPFTKRVFCRRCVRKGKVYHPEALVGKRCRLK